jgi:hypothetical protein
MHAMALRRLLPVILVCVCPWLRASAAGAGAPAERRPLAQLGAVPDFTVEGDEGSVFLRWPEQRVSVVTSLKASGSLDRRREIRRRGSYVQVIDHLRNPGREWVGVRLRHRIDGPSTGARIAGRQAREGASIYGPWNPTVYVPLESGGIGIVAEDDVVRQQIRVGREPGHAWIGTDMLCLPPGESHRVAWTIHPTARRSYWDFLNRLRVVWSVNHTVDGAFTWFTPGSILREPEPSLRSSLARYGIRVASMWGGWIDPADTRKPPVIGFGTHVASSAFARHRDDVRAAVAKLRRARSGIRVLIYFDSQRDGDPSVPRRHPSSLVADAQGTPESTTWGGRYARTWRVVSLAGTEYEAELSAVVRQMRELGADGVYWDEISAVEYSSPAVSFAHEDRRSCVLGEDGRVERRVGLLNLLSAKSKLEHARLAGRVFGNGPPTLMAMQKRGDLRMIEFQHDPEWAGFAHLTTPLAYLGGRRDWAAVVESIDHGLLPATPYRDYSHEILRRLFPLTPEFLEEGTIRGRERLVTTRSGVHGWPSGGGRIRAWRYDEKGREHEAPWASETHGDARYITVTLGSGEVAVVERIE